MKKTLLIAILSAMMGIGAAYGQQSITFNDLGLGGGTANSGSYNSNDTFSFDVNLTFSGYNAFGLSFWLEAANGIAPNILISSVTYGASFPDGTQNATNAMFNTAPGSDPGFMSEDSDLGSTVNDPRPGHDPPIAPGTYFVAHISFTITGAVAGTYTLQSSVLSPHVSQVAREDFGDAPLGAATYTITIVPEPSTAALIALTLAGVGVIAHRRRALRG